MRIAKAIATIMISAQFVRSDMCGDFCRFNPSICGKNGSYCKNKHACHDLFWTNADRSVICSSSAPGCPQTNPVLCRELEVTSTYPAPTSLPQTSSTGRRSLRREDEELAEALRLSRIAEEEARKRSSAASSTSTTTTSTIDAELAAALQQSLIEEEERKRRASMTTSTTTTLTTTTSTTTSTIDADLAAALQQSLIDKEERQRRSAMTTSTTAEVMDEDLLRALEESSRFSGPAETTQEVDEALARALAASLDGEQPGQPFVRDPRPGRLGFHNLGNSCYLAAVVQLLIHATPILDIFRRDGIAMVNPNPVAQAFANIVNDVWTRFDENEGEPLYPRALLTALNQAVDGGALRFVPDRTEDANEVLLIILDHLAMAFEGQLEPAVGMDIRITNTCQFCGSVVPRTDLAFQVNVGIPERGTPAPVADEDAEQDDEVVALDECLRTVVGVEEEIDGYACSSVCDGYTNSMQSTRVTATTEIVIIALKRFKNDGSKIQTEVEIPHVLDSPDLIPGGIFDLIGVGHHSGKTRAGGHYTSMFFHPVHGEWVEANDRAVVTMTNPPPVSSKTAYILVYQKRH